jgi:hypothetical protein
MLCHCYIFGVKLIYIPWLAQSICPQSSVCLLDHGEIKIVLSDILSTLVYSKAHRPVLAHTQYPSNYVSVPNTGLNSQDIKYITFIPSVPRLRLVQLQRGGDVTVSILKYITN